MTGRRGRNHSGEWVKAALSVRGGLKNGKTILGLPDQFEAHPTSDKKIRRVKNRQANLLQLRCIDTVSRYFWAWMGIMV